MGSFELEKFLANGDKKAIKARLFFSFSSSSFFFFFSGILIAVNKKFRQKISSSSLFRLEKSETVPNGTVWYVVAWHSGQRVSEDQDEGETNFFKSLSWEIWFPSSSPGEMYIFVKSPTADQKTCSKVETTPEGAIFIPMQNDVQLFGGFCVRFQMMGWNIERLESATTWQKKRAKAGNVGEIFVACLVVVNMCICVRFDTPSLFPKKKWSKEWRKSLT